MGLRSLLKGIDLGPSKEELIARNVCQKMWDAREGPFGDTIAVRSLKDMFKRWEEEGEFKLMAAVRNHMLSDHPRVKWHFLWGPPKDISKEFLLCRRK